MSVAPAPRESLLGVARTREYRWRLWILLASQPVLAAIGGAFGAYRGTFMEPQFGEAAAITCIVLSCVGVFLRIWASSYLESRVMASGAANADLLVTDGPYAWCRNPLYVGTLLLILAMSVLYGPWIFLAVLVWHVIRYERIAAYEEMHLRGRWGAHFDDYAAHVHRWLPNPFRSRLSDVVVRRQGILSNSLFVAIGIGNVLFALNGSAWWLIGCGLASAPVMIFVHRKRIRQLF
ncbi:hypothetical protein Mal4_10980 [Maioricimonas rarisocia]|uniref:Isoprenylcysteine carboxyl methyltransferase (ICMT) family protein n=1 Tax=Maioricimonas rarisocia TaxID=2528026 RepID=A0A517Z2S5_9PLAN|nr:isoprenylcysteine carboxylmethyltransferase family protein [Maioricimonas rarisocia]QDU36800.1 hypothetical protein Mal4_10980 [Maioricimonas rarisocia]